MSNVNLRKSILIANLNAQMVQNNNYSHEITEEQFEAFKKSLDFDLLVLEEPQFNKFNEDLTKSIAHAFEKGIELGEDIRKAKLDRSKLTQITITDKNGHRRKVWVKRGENKTSTTSNKTAEKTPKFSEGDMVTYSATKYDGTKVYFDGVFLGMEPDGRHARIKPEGHDNTMKVPVVPISQVKKASAPDPSKKLTQEQIGFLDQITDHPLYDRKMGEWSQGKDGRINVKGSILIKQGPTKLVNGRFKVDPIMTELPVTFGEVTGDFEAKFIGLKTLKGMPWFVGGDCKITGNQLESLEGGPKEVRRTFECSDNKLKNLKGGPKKVWADYMCIGNEITTLEGHGIEHLGRDFACSNNKLENLKGSPVEVPGDFFVNGNKLKSLEGAPKYVKRNFWCNKNPTKFTEAQVKEVTKVRMGNIIV